MVKLQASLNEYWLYKIIILKDQWDKELECMTHISITMTDILIAILNGRKLITIKESPRTSNSLKYLCN